MISERERHWRDYGFKLTLGPKATTLTVATYIDNLFSVSNNVDGAILIMRDAEYYLLSKWQLSLKPSSKIVTSAAVGAEFVDGDLIDGYVYQEDFPVLGHMLHNAGSIAHAFAQTTVKMWRAF